MKSEIIVHSWEWNRPTKYIDKYQNKKGNWVYVYDNHLKNKNSRPARYGETTNKSSNKGTLSIGEAYSNLKDAISNNKYTTSHYFDTQNKDDTYYDSNSIGKSKIYVDKRDNKNYAKQLKENVPDSDSSLINRVLKYFGANTSPDYIDLETGRKMSKVKVNAYAALNNLRTSAAKAYGKAYVSFLTSKANRRIDSDFRFMDKNSLDEIKIDKTEVNNYKKYFDNFGENGMSYDDIISNIYKDIYKSTNYSFNPTSLYKPKKYR